MQDGHQAALLKQGKKKGGRGSSNSTVDALADSAVRKLNSIEPRLQLAGQELQFAAQREMVKPRACNFEGIVMDIQPVCSMIPFHHRAQEAHPMYAICTKVGQLASTIAEQCRLACR